jgi:peptide/nickel transport system permease protein
MTSTATAEQNSGAAGTRSRSNLSVLIWRRLGLGVLTIFLVTVLVFLATAVLPGDAARAVLGRGANEAALATLRSQMHLDAPVPVRYGRWIRDIVTGHLGDSLVNQEPVAGLLAQRVVNSAILLGLSGGIGIPLSVGAGILAALRRNRPIDRFMSVLTLVLASLPEFVVGIGLILVFATVVLQWLPPVSLVAPGVSVLSDPRILVLPVATLALVIFPYVFRMTRMTMIDVLASDYMEMAELKGLSRARQILVHALPNAVPPTIQVVALTFAYLAGGTVLIEYLFGYAGLGQGLMNAIEARDIPIIQAIVLLLAGVYVLLNVTADVACILVTPRLRTAPVWHSK